MGASLKFASDVSRKLGESLLFWSCFGPSAPFVSLKSNKSDVQSCFDLNVGFPQLQPICDLDQVQKEIMVVVGALTSKNIALTPGLADAILRLT